MKQKKPILGTDNMKQCFLWLLRRVAKRSRYELPYEDEKFFKSFAESTSVADGCFNCHAISLAVVRQEPITINGKEKYLASLELHALSKILYMDISAYIIIDNKKAVHEYLDQDENIIVEKLIKTFEQLDNSLQEKQ
jgi:hypothetical protein